MPKLSLLDMTQDILSDMSSDEVNSINDTVESLQIAGIIKSTYFNIIDGRDWPHLYQMFVLTASGDITKPTHMSLSDSILDVEWLKYNVKTTTDSVDSFRDILYKTPKEFMSILDARGNGTPYIQVVEDATTIDLNIYNDRQPSYFTSFDNEKIILDAYNIALESTLQSSKTQGYGKVYPTWSMTDTFVPDLPTVSFSYLLNEAKSTCFQRLAQTPDQKSEQHSVSQRRRITKDAWRVADPIKYQAFGRSGKK